MYCFGSNYILFLLLLLLLYYYKLQIVVVIVVVAAEKCVGTAVRCSFRKTWRRCPWPWPWLPRCGSCRPPIVWSFRTPWGHWAKSTGKKDAHVDSSGCFFFFFFFSMDLVVEIVKISPNIIKSAAAAVGYRFKRHTTASVFTVILYLVLSFMPVPCTLVLQQALPQKNIGLIISRSKNTPWLFEHVFYMSWYWIATSRWSENPTISFCFEALRTSSLNWPSMVLPWSPHSSCDLVKSQRLDFVGKMPCQPCEKLIAEVHFLSRGSASWLYVSGL